MPFKKSLTLLTSDIMPDCPSKKWNDLDAQSSSATPVVFYIKPDDIERAGGS